MLGLSSISPPWLAWPEKDVEDKKDGHGRCFKRNYKKVDGMAKHKYIIQKGWQGFCDRLQTTSYCISLAKMYNRILYIDWRDRIWTHDEKDFYSYFYLTDVEYITSFTTIPKDLSVYPSFWQDILNKPADDWVHSLKDYTNMHLEDWPYEDVWVNNSVDYRRWDFDQLANVLRFKEEIAIEIAGMIRYKNDRPIVHLRGTDKDFVFSQERFYMLAEKYPDAYILSDDAELVEKWLEKNPDAVVLSDQLQKGKGGGHLRSAKELQDIGTTKHQMNLRMLADFIMLASATEAYELIEESAFFQMARLFGKCGGCFKIFNFNDPDSVVKGI